jgi:hypothetical protein
MGDFSIAAPVPIPFASGTQALRVSGPGRMTFPSSQDFDGRELDRPVLVTVRWSERMDFAGKDNRADFLGAVHVETPDSTYDCSALRVDFRDAVRKPAQPTAMERIDWWLFEPLVDRWQRPDERRWRAGGDDAFDKEPIRFFALGGVKAINRNVDPRDRKLRSRVLITGPQMSVDLEQHVVQVDGSGSLLIEDYRPATRKIPSQVTTAPAGEEGVISPLGRWSTSGSSQTYVAWEGLMNYRYRDNVARFERDVTLVHSKGAKMKLAPTQGASEAGAGQESHLNCAKLTVEFEQRDASAPSGRRAGTSRLSGNEVRNFTAEGKVYVHDSGVTAIARTITYSRADNLLQILGTETDPAQIYDEREGRPGTITGSRIVWDMATNKIWVPQSRARMN